MNHPDRGRSCHVGMAGARSQDRYDLRFRSVVRIVIRLWFPSDRVIRHPGDSQRRITIRLRTEDVTSVVQARPQAAIRTGHLS